MNRRRRHAGTVALVGAVMEMSGVAAAETEEARLPRPSTHVVEVGFGAQSALAFGDVCYGHTDVLECSQGFFMNGIHLAPRWRVAPAFSVGLLGSASWVSNLGFESHTFWSAEAEGRWHPVVGSSVDPWLGIDAGVMTIVDRYDQTPYSPEQKFVHASPMLGVGIGTDFQLASFLAIGPALRGFLIFSGDDRSVGAVMNRAPRYDTQFGVGLTLSGTLLVGAQP